MADQSLSLLKIPISELKPGMYVCNIFSGKKDISVKSEGYVSTAGAISRLASSGVTFVTVDPSKQKKSEQIDKILPDTQEAEPEEQTPVRKVSLEKEMETASALYQDAKGLQTKILTSIADGKSFDINEARACTDDMVDSIFRNEDALACMSRLRMKDEYLVEHSLNVSILMTIFAKHMQEDRKLIEQLALGAFLHDIGKIKIPDEILNKPGRLTAEEYEVMKSHVTLGTEVIDESPEISNVVAKMVKEHHERLDGNGYPESLPAEKISKFGRMIAIVDSYDAMTAERVYKAGMHPIKAFKNLVNESPTAYDDALVEKFIQCLGIYPVGTLVKLNSGKIGLISQLNKSKPLQPYVRVFYNARMNQAIAMEEINLAKCKYKDQIDTCIKPEEFNLNLMKFFKAAFID